MRIFISSATGALRTYRQAAVDVCYRLGLTPVHMEDFDPQRPAPKEVCRRAVESCDLFVLLLAHRYGHRPPGSELSYTELEYIWALERQMDLLVFVVDPDLPWPPRDIDRGADADALDRFVGKVRERHTVRAFGELPLFREDLLFALKRRPTIPAAGAETEGARPPARVSAPPEFHAVPAYAGSAPFTGRAEDLATLDDWGCSADPVIVVEAIGGAGKSALTWVWTQDRATAVIGKLAGRMWWSFYEGSASMTRFLQELLAYTSERPLEQVERLTWTDLADEVFAALRSRPYLIVLDGFERLLAAYHRFDPSKLRDEEIEPDKRSLIDPNAEDIVRRLAVAGPSKILISTRLMPTALQGRFGMLMPGVRHLRLPGLTDADTWTLLERLGVRGNPFSIATFFGSLGNHPLLTGIVAGLVRDYRPEPGGFDRWLADPSAGGALSVPDLELTQRRTHILAAAFAGLDPGPERLLGWISVLPGAVAWATLQAINPFGSPPSAGPEPDRDPPAMGMGRAIPEHGPKRPGSRHSQDPWRGVQARDFRGSVPARLLWTLERSYLSSVAGSIRNASAEMAQPQAASSPELVLQAEALLDAALKDLEDRGLLWWDRSSNTYDLHPIIRAYSYDQLQDADRVQANDRVRDYFQALPPENPAEATSVEDLIRILTIFRTQIGAGHLAEAAAMWPELSQVLLVNLGAYATVTELLGPLASRGTPRIRGDLSIAYHFLGQYDAAISADTKLLANMLGTKRAPAIATILSRLSTYLAETGADIAAARYLDLWTALNVGDDGELCRHRAALATAQGRIEQARQFIDQAEQFGPATLSPWFAETIEYQRLHLALVTDAPLTRPQLAEAAARSRSWHYRRSLAALSYEICARQGEYGQALAAARQEEQLGRNADLDVAPAKSAFALAKLGRVSEAAAAVEESLDRFPRIHPARRHHYSLAQALRELARHAEAVEHAREAYRQAWHDGPPHCNYWGLRDARALLLALGEPVPDLAIIDPAELKVPLEDEIRAIAAELGARRPYQGGLSPLPGKGALIHAAVRNAAVASHTQT